MTIADPYPTVFDPLLLAWQATIFLIETPAMSRAHVAFCEGRRRTWGESGRQNNWMSIGHAYTIIVSPLVRSSLAQRSRLRPLCKSSLHVDHLFCEDIMPQED